MSVNKFRTMLAMYSLAAMNSDSLTGIEVEKKESDQEREKRLSEATVKRNKRQGLTQYFYGENSVWALKKETADKKAKRNGWL